LRSAEIDQMKYTATIHPSSATIASATGTGRFSSALRAMATLSAPACTLQNCNVSAFHAQMK
jgi:hypothetical protein